MGIEALGIPFLPIKNRKHEPIPSCYNIVLETVKKLYNVECKYPTMHSNIQIHTYTAMYVRMAVVQIFVPKVAMRGVPYLVRSAL